MMHIFVFQINFLDSDGCQIWHGAATWCLLRPRTVKSSVGTLYRLFRIDLYALRYVGAIDVVVLQGEVNLSDSERCQSLHIAVLCMLSTTHYRGTSLIRNFNPPGTTIGP